MEVEDPILLECVATHGYKGMYEDELSFNSGDRVEVTADSKSGWRVLLIVSLGGGVTVLCVRT